MPRALVVAAHPDDIEFGCSGSVARWVDEGWEVAYVLVTSGQRGTQDPRADPAQVGATRERETREAARIVGVGDVTFLGYMDGDLLVADPVALRKDLARQFRRVRPDRLVSMDPDILPTSWFINHPDHRIAATATLDVVETGGTTGAIFPELELDEGLPPWRGCEEVWITGPAGGPVVVDITTTIDRRLDALRAHVSQMDGWDAPALVRGFLAKAGEAHGMGYAETFRVINLRR